MAFDNILVVCVGNICRSPMAMALLQAQYLDKHIDSAGVSAAVGQPADTAAIEVMKAQKIDITDHISKQITSELTVNADLILTMSISEAKWIKSKWPHCRGKIFRLGHWLEKDIPDPYRHEFSAFEAAYQDIVASLKLWEDKIS
jgi:protein-tyrosine phosphatase